MPRTPRQQERAKVWATKYECKNLILEICSNVPEFFCFQGREIKSFK